MPLRGRFAPSPTGPLHMGSLATALASWLDARSNGYEWLVRIEDIDTPREEPGAAAQILHQLKSHGLHWDYWNGDGSVAEGILYQSHRDTAYREVLISLIARGLAYPCTCSRKKLQYAVDAGKTKHNPDGEILYPGYCRPAAEYSVKQEEARAALHAALQATPLGLKPSAHQAQANKQADMLFREQDHEGVSWRFRNPNGDDFVLRRADGFWAYHLAAVTDDEFQGITTIVRGDDLLHAAPRHTVLRAALGYAEPKVFHVPVVRNDLGEKLSKQTLAMPLRTDNAETIRLQLECAWSHLELTMPIGWVERVRGVSGLLRQKSKRVYGV